jgi:hypothetical protein
MRTFIPLNIDSSALSIANDVAKPGDSQLPKLMCLMTEPDRLWKLIDDAGVTIDQKQPIGRSRADLCGPEITKNALNSHLINSRPVRKKSQKFAVLSAA